MPFAPDSPGENSFVHAELPIRQIELVGSEMEVTIAVVVVVVLIPVVYIVGTYNSLVALRNHVPESWSNVDTELMRRYDLIPNLVAAVKGYAAHEQETLQRVIELRNTCMADHGSVRHQEGTEKALVSASAKVTRCCGRLSRPKSQHEVSLALQVELVNTEDRIQAARRFYNGNVRDYRNLCEGFPSLLVAKLFGFERRDFFDVDPVVRESPSVQINA